jgi:hypothetical protein
MDSRVSWLLTSGIAIFLIWLAFTLTSGGSEPGATPATPGNSPGATPPAGTSQVSDRSAIDDLLTRTFTQNDPNQCTQDLTRAYLRQNFGSEKGALDRCRRRNTPQSPKGAESIEIQSVTGGGSSATAVLRQTSKNTLDGSVVTLRLVREGGRWKLNQFVDIQIDRSRFDQHLRDELGARGYLPAETSCAVAKLDRTVSNAEIERDVVIGDSSYEYLTSTAVSCLQRSTLLRELGELMRAALSGHGFSPRFTRCVVDRLTHGVPIVRLRHMIAAGSRSAEAWWRLSYQAVEACTGGGTTNATQPATI